MGKRSSQRKTAAMLDSDDDDSLSPSPPVMSDLTALETKEVHAKVRSGGNYLLDQCVDALYEKRGGSTREKALSTIVDAFTNKLQHQFVEKNCVTLLHPCLNSIKRGSTKEISLASRAIGLLALTIGCGDDGAHEIFELSIPPLSQALKSGSESLKISSILDCLAVVTFVGRNGPEEIERSMQIMWQIIHPKSGSNVNASKTTAVVLTAAIAAWSFLLTTMSEFRINSKNWQDPISYFSSLLDKDDRSVRIAAGEAIALIFEIGHLDKFFGEAKGSSDNLVHEGNKSQEGFAYIDGLKGKILTQVRNLSVEAGGKGSTKKDLGSQRNLFRDVVEFLEGGYCPKTSIKIGGDLINLSTWSQFIQLNFLKHFLGGGFAKHMQENELLHDVFDYTPKRKNLSGNEQHFSSSQKVANVYLPIVRHQASYQRMFKSPNSVLNKARTQLLNKQRTLSQGRNTGHYAVGVGSEDA